MLISHSFSVSELPARPAVLLTLLKQASIWPMTSSNTDSSTPGLPR
jgi:hypothetical protein